VHDPAGRIVILGANGSASVIGLAPGQEGGWEEGRGLA
jgi:hypothetical protein